MARIIPSHLISRCRDTKDGLAAFSFIGYSEDAALVMMTVNSSASLGAVAVEHTHPPQAYLLPRRASQQRVIKADAQKVWKTILTKGQAGPSP
jgi:hypothetical protein